MNKVLNMTFASSLTHLCEVNSSFDTGILRVCYTGENRNRSYISREAIEKSLPTIYNCPVVCHYDRENDTLGGHDMALVRNEDDDSFRLVNLTTPVGVIPESAKVWFEDVTEEDGTINEYLFTEVLLWKRQEAYRKLKEDGITSQSMEITVKEGESVDGTYNIDEFEFTAFALIGVEPCFESAALELFSKADFKEQLREMMQDLKESFTCCDTSAIDDHINLNESSMEGGKRVLDEKMNLVAEYGIDVDSLDFSLEDLTVDELKEKFEEMTKSEEDVEPEPVEEAFDASEDKPEPEQAEDLSDDATPADESVEEDVVEDAFALNSNLMDELIRAVRAETVSDDWGEWPRYCFVDCDFDANEVYCWDCTDWFLYGFAFVVDGDAISVDFDSKKRKKFTIVDFEGGEQNSPVAPVAELYTDKLACRKELEEKFNTASDTIASLETELDELRKYKTDTENAIATQQREEVFSNFKDLEGIEAFEELRSESEKFDVDVLVEKCFAIRGKNVASLTFSEKGKSPKIMVEKAKDEYEPYGGLFLEYGNKGSE